MRRRAWAMLATVVLLAAGCSEENRADELDAAVPWRTSSDPVETGGLIWASGSTVHLSEGTTIEVDDLVKAYVVAGDGVYFFPAEDEAEVASVGFEDRELSFADRDGTVSGTGLTLMTSSLTASPDGRYLAGIDMSIGEEDQFGTRLATARVFDLVTGEEVVRSADGMGDPGEDDLSVLYENVEIGVAALTDDTAYVDTATGVIAYDLGSGEGVPLPDDEEPPSTPDAYHAAESPDGAWTIEETPDLRDVLTSSDGTTVTPQTGTDRWLLSWWLDDRTVVGVAVSGSGRGPKVAARDTTTLMTCVVPSGGCDVVEESSGQFVVFPRGASHQAGVVLQDGEGRAP